LSRVVSGVGLWFFRAGRILSSPTQTVKQFLKLIVDALVIEGQ
jgi:hypothetical protein